MSETPQTPPPGGSPTPPSQPPPPSGPKEWMVAVGGQQMGPYSVAEIAAEIQSGRAQPTDLAWKQGMAQWTPMNAIPELAPAVSSAAPRVGLSPEQMQAFQQKARVAGAVSKQATMNAFSAFKVFSVDPVGGLPAAYTSLGAAAAFSVGIVFVVVFELLGFLATNIALDGHLMKVLEFGDLVKFIIAMAMPATGIVLGLLLLQQVLKLGGTFHASVFVSGASMLPVGIAVALCALMGSGPLPLILMVFANCYVVLILFSALTKIYGVSEGMAAVYIPLVIAFAGGFTWLVVTKMLEFGIPVPGMGGMSGMNMPF